MSAGNRSRSPRAGGKGSAPKKKAKKAKNEFQGRKKYYASTTEVDKEDVRKRALDSLQHLGHQVLSNDPGGYSMQSWSKGLRTLLDDFEDKIGADLISEDYRTRRAAVLEEFSKPADTSKIDEEAEEIRTEERDIRAKLKEESERITSRLSAIGGEKTGRTIELREERIKLVKAEEDRRQVSFFSKLVGRSGPSPEPIQKRVQDLEKGLQMLEEETINLQAVRKSLDGGRSTGTGAFDDLWKRLTAIEGRLTELHGARESKMQLLQERERAAEALRTVISELQLKGEEEGQEEVEPSAPPKDD